MTENGLPTADDSPTTAMPATPAAAGAGASGPAGAAAADAADAAEIAALRAEIASLEGRLRSRAAAGGAGESRTRGSAKETLLTGAVGVLAAAVAFMFVPAMLSFKRMLRWWRA